MANYYFIGIGGIGMGKLASLLLAKGEAVAGSDLCENAMVKSLRQQGADIMIGHDAVNIKDATDVIYSSAVKEDNPELQEAQQRGCRILRRAELLAELIRDYQSITVAGAHGKTTTTSMIAHLLLSQGLDPTVALGGVFHQGSYQETLGRGKYFVAELDESDGSFLLFSPHISVVTNIDFEHVDHYGTWDNILQAYQTFIDQTQEKGLLVACGDDARLREIVRHARSNVLLYGLSPENDLYATEIQVQDNQTYFMCCVKGQALGRVSLNVIGCHNVLNALACIAVGMHIGVPFSDITKGLLSYHGVHRRFERKGKWDDIVLYDDYAHHPTEIRSTLDAVKQLCPKRIVAAFQPHRYSRTKFLWEEFQTAFGNADIVFVTDIYAASEKKSSAVNIRELCDGIAARSCCQVYYVKKESLDEEVVSAVESGDVIITLGAGDITKISDQIALRLDTKFAVHYES